MSRGKVLPVKVSCLFMAKAGILRPRVCCDSIDRFADSACTRFQLITEQERDGALWSPVYWNSTDWTGNFQRLVLVQNQDKPGFIPNQVRHADDIYHREFFQTCSAGSRLCNQLIVLL